MTQNPQDLGAFTLAVMAVHRFSDANPGHVIAAMQRKDGSIARLLMADLRALCSEASSAGGRLERIASWHSRETAPGGMVGDFCIECGYVWPCETRRMADGTHEDLVE